MFVREPLRKGRASIVDAMRPISDVARKRPTHTRLHSVWLNLRTDPLALLIVLLESDPATISKLEKAVGETNAGGKYQFCLMHRLKSTTTFADVEGYTRIVWDNLSYGTADEGSADLDFWTDESTH